MSFELKVPSVGESINEVTIGGWLKSTGDFIETGEIVCEIESEKATFEVISDHSGILTIKHDTGDNVKVGAIIGIIEAGSVKTDEISSKKDSISDSSEKINLDENILNQPNTQKKYPSPAAQKLIKEAGINENTISGTGRDGRILKKDALNVQFQSNKENSFANSDIKKKEEMAEKSQLFNRNNRKPISQFQKAFIQESMQLKNQMNILDSFCEVDVSCIEKGRKKYQDTYIKRYGVKLNLISFIIRAAIEALKEFPDFNAYLDENEIIYHTAYHIGIEMITDHGLVTPVIQNADQLPLHEISNLIQELKERAKNFTLKLEDIETANFTIGGLGAGTIMNSSMIYPKQSSILMFQEVREQAMVIDANIQIRPVIGLKLFYNHYMIDRSQSSMFLLRIKEYLEDPYRMLLKV